jgi:hypothetical protein
MVEFALAQNVCNEDVLDNTTLPIKPRRVQFASDMESKRKEYARGKNELSKIEVSGVDEEGDVTDKYIRRLYDDLGKANIREFNRVRIK